MDLCIQYLCKSVKKKYFFKFMLYYFFLFINNTIYT